MASRRKKKTKESEMSDKDSGAGLVPHEFDESTIADDTYGSQTFNRYVTYNFVKCDNIQVGNENKLICGAREMLENSSAAGIHRESGRDKVIVGMINSILNPECSDKPAQMNLQKLESAFNRLYGAIEAGKPKTFRDIAGRKLLQFVERYKDVFDLSMQQQQWVVKQNLRKRRQRKKKSPASHHGQLRRCQSQLSEDEESQYTSAQSGTPLGVSREPSPERLLSREITQQQIDQAVSEWTEVYVSKKKREKLSPDTSTSTRQVPPNDDDSTSPPEVQPQPQQFLGQCPIMRHDELLAILNLKEGPDLLLRESEYLYFTNPMLLTLDLVSLWNTPNRSESHIVLGVTKDGSSHKVEGLLSSHSTYEFQDIFLSEHFNMIPSFVYREVIIHEKRVGILTVASSAGQGFPSVVIKDNETEPRVQAEQLWYRRGNENVVCKTSDLTTGLIYQWFVGAIREQIGGQRTSDYQRNKKLHDQSEQTDSSIERDNTPPDPTYSSSVADLLRCVDSFQKGHFILVAGPIPSSTRYLNALAKIPWIYVFDFDVYSRERGLLAVCEDQIKRLRSFHLSYWSRYPSGISEYATHWCFLRGVRDIPESRVEGDSREWFRTTKQGVEKHCLQIAKFTNDYTVLRVVVFWPDLDFHPMHLLKFLQRLDESLEVSPKIILCFETEPQSTTGKTAFQMMRSELHLSGLMKMPVEKLCMGIHGLVENGSRQESVKHTIPSYPDAVAQEISERDQAWLREDLDVLYLQNPYTKSSDINVIQDEGDNFFKGGTLQWVTWYECGAGHFDVERDILGNIVQKMKSLCNTPCKSVMITLFHAPGAGGTTLAQRILWELHSMTPCVQVKSRSGSTPEQLADRMECLYEASHSPIIIMVDGEDETRVEMLSKRLTKISSIILYVKRYPYPMGDRTSRENGNRLRYWLKGEVTSGEANRLALKLRDRCQEDRRKRSLETLSKNVSEGKTHCMYEFGLTAFLHEFRGIESYVRGYLHLDQNPGKSLHNWQLLLGYLALVHYYGQTSIPCQFFASLLGKQSNYDVSIDDFHPGARGFIVEDTLEARSKFIRTSHYIIAQEILEQILTRKREGPLKGMGDRQHPNFGLSKLAKQNLETFAFGFIEYSSKKKTKTSTTSGTVVHILTRSFIFREYRDSGEGSEDVQNRKRPLLSRLISDIDSFPPYTERLRVLEKLTASYPSDPNFHAHLGRFYAYCRPDDEDKAEECFKTALSLCELQRDGRKSTDADDKLNLTLMHIYHMYGMIYQRRIKSLKKNIPGLTGSISPQLLDKILEVLRLAEMSCDLFLKCRQHTPVGQELCYGYVGEISVRLEVCDLIQKVFPRGVNAYISSPDGEPGLVEFLKYSISQIDNLVMECYSVIETYELDKSFFQVVFWFNTIFHKAAISLEGLELPDDSESRRLKIAVKKLKFGKADSSIPVLEDIGTEADITQIVTMYEENFREVRESGDVGNMMGLEMDHKEWLFAIRHSRFRNTYRLEDVRVQVQHWYDNLKTPLSLFYLFVVTSLMGFGGEGCGTNTHSLIEAQTTLKQDLKKMSKNVPRPRSPREWLGKGEGIRRLVSGARFPIGYIDCYKRHMQGPLENLLAVCKGTICGPNNKRLSGYINLDLGDNRVSVKVFFIPKVCDLIGPRFEGERVEFLLAFTLDLGYEGFNVCLIKKVSCSHCETVVEMKSDEEAVICPCGQAICRRAADLFEGDACPGAGPRDRGAMS